MNQTFENAVQQFNEKGVVSQVRGEVALVRGLPGAVVGEQVLFDEGSVGRVMGLYDAHVEVLVVNKQPVEIGTEVVRTGEKVSVLVGEHLLGREVDALGRVNGEVVVERGERRELFASAPRLKERAEVQRPYSSGVVVADMAMPLAKGQRELILGDAKTGKTHFGLQSLVQQVNEGAVGVYVALGKTHQEVGRVKRYLEEHGVANAVIMVVAMANDSAAEMFLAAYTGMSIAEYFKDTGRDVTIVLDDMSTHAKFYREISLTAGRFPGRDAYPGDIFHIHAALMERAGSFLLPEGKTATITALPICSTVAGDVSGYIQTNLMSMTDGHLYFDRELFQMGRRPAINLFLSVTRVGWQVQTKLKHDLGSRLMQVISEAETASRYMRFGAELPKKVQALLERRDVLWEWLEQGDAEVLAEPLQVFLTALVVTGVWEGENRETWVERYRMDEEWRRRVGEVVGNAESVDELVETARKEILMWGKEEDA